MKVTTDTIVAQATPPGRGGVAIVRVSGPLVSSITHHIIQKNLKARHATYSNFFSEKNELIDQGIACYFPNPHSFTGEDILELHTHGSPIVINTLIESILFYGARLARPGEFSLRAFLNNRMDLTQAEAIADLINASSKQAAKNALNSLQGVFSKKIHALLDQLIQLRMMIEAEIDFTEEEINFLDPLVIQQKIQTNLTTLHHILKTAQQGSLLREGITAVISGEPNVGKSSLLNALSKRDAAIVTDIPGTTRDILREYIQIGGLPIHLIDTAGIRESNDPIEQEGIRRAQVEIQKADLVIHVVDATQPIPQKLSQLIIRNKIDLINEKPSIMHENDAALISLSAKTGEGLELLEQYIQNCFDLTTNEESLFSARQRHIDALIKAEKSLQNGFQNLTSSTRELLAEDLRQAQNALNEITGEFTSDDLLGKIFSNFCIGK